MNRSIYIHYPFCQKQCNYCDFTVSTDFSLKNSYFEALIFEINNFPIYQNNDIINSIYIGGGTPSIIDINQLDELLNTLNKKLNINFKDNFEFTIEVNPGTVDKNKLREFHNLGVNRLSIGVQTFNKKELGVITRNHSPNNALKTVKDAQSVGFDNINLDLMFSLPFQTQKSYLENLKIAIDLNVSHLSTYSLIYEPNTKLWNDWKAGKIKKHGKEFDADLYSESIDFLLENDFEQYEVSNFAKDKKYCFHNLSAWQAKEYYAFGVSSHGFIDNMRYSNTKNLSTYLKNFKENLSQVEIKEILTNQQKIEEYIFLGLRSLGIDKSILEKEFNIYFDKKTNDFLDELVNKEILTDKDNKIQLKKNGYLICDTITYKILDLVLNY